MNRGYKISIIKRKDAKTLRIKFSSLRLCAFALILFNLFQLNSQELKKFKSISSRESNYTKVLLDSATLFSEKNPSKSFDYLEKALSSSVKSGDKYSEALTYQFLGNINFKLNQPDLAKLYYLKALPLFENLNNKNKLNETRIFLGDVYAQDKESEKALEYYNTGLKFYERENNTEQIFTIKNKIADLYAQKGNVKQASSLYKEVTKDAEKQANQKVAIEAQTKLGDAYVLAEEPNQALNAYNRAEEIAVKSNDPKAVSNTLQKKGKVLRSTKQYDSEIELRQNIIDLETENNNPDIVAAQNFEIGNVYLNKNETDKAIPYIEKSIQIAEVTGNIEQKSEALKTLSAAYSLKNDFNKALNIYKLYVATVDAIHQKKEQELKESAEITATLSRKLQRLDLIEKELSLSEKTLDILQQEQQVNQKQLRVRKVFNVSIGIAFIILTIASIVVYRSNLLKRKANQMLALKSLRSQMNPHFIYNALNSVNNYISKNDEKSANKYLSDFSKLMRSVMENSKHDFVSLSSETDIIALYLKLEQSRFSDKFDYKFTISPDLDTDQYFVPPMLIQPFIENAIWHGLRYREDKGFLNINIGKENSDLKVIIEDNGIGRKKSEELKTKNQKEHVSTGLRNIENRIKIINEMYRNKIGITIEDLDKNTKTGTCVTILIPLKNEQSHT
jgi:tetratricopeptide (TPR) repeat protein